MTLACSIKRFNLNLLKEVLDIEMESFPRYPYDEEVFVLLQAMYPELFLVAECEGSITGYACGVLESSGCAHLFSIAVRRSYRRQGIGSRLLQEFESIAKALGASCVVLEVAASNVIARRFYIKHGYREKGVREAYYPDGDSAIIMEKNL